jgi:hypothetical protein
LRYSQKQHSPPSKTSIKYDTFNKKHHHITNFML